MNKRHAVLAASLMCLGLISNLAMTEIQTNNPNPPDEVVKLIFIHHSTGENWLKDDYGNLGRRLGENNYFVSDTNYGWGPEAIGDRTDIPNWTEWFRSENTPVYMDALFNESGQNASYERWLEDPGGENQIILFKSCFPNSALEGGPDDPAGDYEELTVSGAKYVYNQILQYFATRPDKLFVVITAPPLTDSTYAQNARAFNQWLLNDWLRENEYTLPNVAIFDFYNVLTDPNAHHRMNQGQVEYVLGAGNTSRYPSEDDHPSATGSQKATEEFVPLLNAFYHRWHSAGFPEPAGAVSGPVAQEEQPSIPTVGIIDDFEGGPIADTEYWQAFWDEQTSTTATCAVQSSVVHSGVQALQYDFNVAPDSWTTCALIDWQQQNWSGAEGIEFNYRVSQAGLVFDVDLYTGKPDERQTYLYTVEAVQGRIENWISISLSWDEFHRASWEAYAGTVFNKADQIVGLAFGASTFPDTPNAGTLWIDDLKLIGAEAVSQDIQPESEEGSKPGRLLPCAGSVGVPLGLLWLGFRKRTGKI